MARGWGGGRVNCGRVHAIFNQEITPSEPHPILILFDLLHCYKKLIHAVGDHHRPRKNARSLATQIHICSQEEIILLHVLILFCISYFSCVVFLHYSINLSKKVMLCITFLSLLCGRALLLKVNTGSNIVKSNIRYAQHCA